MSDTDNQRAIYTPEELQRLLGISRRKVYDCLNSGEIPSIRLNKRFVIPKSAIEQWLRDAHRPTAPVKVTA